MLKPFCAVTMIALLLGGTAARAVEIPAAEQSTLETYGETNKTCFEWSDGCAVCVRRDDGTFACSLPGIACEPKGLTCRAEATPSATSPGANKVDETPKPK